MAVTDAVFRRLKAITGPEGITRDPEDLVCYSFDATGRSYMPEAVVSPASTDQVAQVMQLACRHRFTVTPRGSGSGMTGGSLPIKGGIVLVFDRMNRILDIDQDNFVAHVEPGVVTADFHRAVEKIGLFYPPDPASSAFCTLGGNIGECAGGPRAVKYGVTRDYVLGLDAVLPSGDVIHTGVRTAKGVAGYDLTRLIVGSEGTLAVVAGIYLKLLPLPASVRTLAVLFGNMRDAARTVSGIMGQGIVPRCIEYLDRASIRLVSSEISKALSCQVDDTIQAMLIIEVDGSETSVTDDSRAIEAFLRDRNARHVVAAGSAAEAQALWKARKALSPILYSLAPNKINEDIVVPISRIPEMVDRLEQLEKKSGLTVVSFGHAGDGNIHCNIMYDRRDPDQDRRAHEAVDELFAHTLELGGTITGEHGVGITKINYLPKEAGPVELNLMAQIKAVFDPHGILNPGKIFSVK